MDSNYVTFAIQTTWHLSLWLRKKSPGGIVGGSYDNLGGERRLFGLTSKVSFEFHRLIVRANYFVSRLRDSRRTAIPPKVLKKIFEGTVRYTYRDVACMKNPFDLAIYLKLLNDLRPKTIIEIGSLGGGSGVFFAEQSGLLGIETKVWSFDINPVIGIDSPRLTFLGGDIYDLGASELPSILENAERPLLVIEDGPHTFNGCLSALTFFHNYLASGDYIVIEDGNLRDLGILELENGPNRAVREFLSRYSESYQIDYALCDSFGVNVTWNTDGYIRKV